MLDLSKSLDIILLVCVCVCVCARAQVIYNMTMMCCSRCFGGTRARAISERDVATYSLLICLLTNLRSLTHIVFLH